MIKQMKKAFEEWIKDEDPFPDSAIEWDHYDSNVRIVFFRVEGRWDTEMKRGIAKFLRQYKPKVLANRIIKGG
jgi:hypothetical protein